MGIPTREVYWNIENYWLMYVLLVPTMLLFCYGIYRRWRLWQLGRPDAERDGRRHWRQRLALVRTFVLGHRRLLSDSLSGTMHLMVFYSMLLLLMGTTVVFIHEDFKIPIMQGWFYLVFQSLVLEIAGAFLLLACGIALWRRYGERLGRLQFNRGEERRREGDLSQVVFLFVMAAQGFVLGGLRIAGTEDPWAAWSPLSNLISRGLASLSSAAIVGSYQFFWWFHLLTAFVWIAYLPYSKALHIFTSPLNVYYGNLQPAGMALQPIDFESTDRLGAIAITDFTRKDLLDLDACTACGRCQAVCPAHAAGTPLSPKNLILDLRDYMTDHGQKLLKGEAIDDLPPVIGDYVNPEALWACTTCRACMEACPVLIDHVPKIVNMRRHLVMEQAEMPETLADMVKSMEDRAHPYKGANASRTDWAEGLDIPILAAVESADVLLWVGCTGAFDPRNQKVVRAFATVMQTAGLSFAILGDEEPCTGDPARRVGHEFLYDMQARANVELLNAYQPRFKRIVTACPHCMNQLGNEYKALGGDYKVLHHSQLLQELIAEGRLPLDPTDLEQVTYHDPCYLGRYNDEYDAPRAALAAAGSHLIEMERSRAQSFCCGAGGAHAWMEETHGGPRVNQLRAKEALQTGAGTICTSCPFCLQMMEDGVKTMGDEDAVRVKDLAEIIAESLPKTSGKS